MGTLIVLVVVICCCRRTCCSKENSLSEVSTGTQGTRVSLPQSVQGRNQNTEHLSISQECIKPPAALHSPSPSSDRPPSHLSQVSYNDLCFPKTSNYGSMRKQGRCEVVGRLEERLAGRNQLPPHRAPHLHSHL